MTERKALEYVEVDIDWGSCVYGQGACTAAIGVTGSIKCFNTLATCQDRAHIDLDPVTLRFGRPAEYRPEDIEAIPSIVSVDFTPARLEPGESLGSRSSLRVTFRDHPHSDTGPGFDKYHTERPYDPFNQGSFWAKFRARQPFLRGEPVRWRFGFVGDTLEEMETRHFLVESFDGPTPDGTYTLVCKDPLKLADGDRANAPMPSTGYLNADITNSATSAVLAPAGVGNAEYPGSGFLNIGGKEIVAFTRSGDNLTITRGQKNTTGVAHAGEERVQLCLEYTGDSPAAIAYDLLVNYAGLEPASCSQSTWQGEIDAYLRRDYARFIAEPTSVNQLLSELSENAGLAIWWDDVAEQVRLQVMRQIATDAALYSDELLTMGSFKVKEQPTARVSQVWCGYAVNNPLKGLEDKDNYRQYHVAVDAENEEDYGQATIRKLWAPWIPFGGKSTAERACDLIIGRYGRPPRLFSFSLFRGAQDAPVLGAGYQLEARVLQDATGARERVPIQIVELRPTRGGWDVTALEMSYVAQDSDDVASKTITINVNTNGVDFRALHDTLFPDPVAGDDVTLIVETGVIVGANTYGAPALYCGAGIGQSGTRTNGSPVITGLPSTSSMDVGHFVYGTGIPAGAKIESIDSGTQITLTANASSSGTSTVTVSDWPYVAQNGTRSSGSAVITGLASTATFEAGMGVTGAGIPNGTRILSVDSGTQITLDQNASSSGTATVTVWTVILNLLLRGRLQGSGGQGGNGASWNPTYEPSSGYAGGPALYTRVPLNLTLNEGQGRSWGGGGGGGGVDVLNLNEHRGGGGGGGAGIPPGPGGWAVGPASYGGYGGTDGGGPGGYSHASYAWSQWPYSPTGAYGGQGGAPGQYGSIGNHHGGNPWEQSPGAGGPPGAAIDGTSWVKKTGTGDLRGGEIN